MPDIDGTKLSQLPLGENLANDDLMYAVEDGISKKVEIEYLKNRFVGDLTLADLGDDSTHRLVTDAEKTAWSGKQDALTFDNAPTSGSSNPVKSSGIYTALGTKANTSDLATVATTGDYDDLTDKPTIPTVEANPLGEATAELTKVGINNTIYEIIGGEKVYGEASGAIASFSDGSANPLVKLEADINPIQDLHGYDKPWTGGAGKNKFDISRVTNYEDPGSHAAVVNNGDGTITVTATASTNVSCGKNLGEIADLTVGEKYRLTATSTGSLNYIFLHGGNTLWYFNGQEMTITQEMIDGKVSFYASGTNTSATISNLMIRPTNTDATYEPYSNICPISGWSSVEVTVADDTTDPTTEETYEITLGQTVYGGTLNVTTGELTVDRAMVDLGTLNFNYDSSGQRWQVIVPDIYNYPSRSGNLVAEKYVADTSASAGSEGKMFTVSKGLYIYSTDGTTPPSGNLVYPLATPTTISLTPTQVSSLLGNNNIWADSGDVDVVYIRDLNLFLTQLDARVKALENA